MTFKERNKLSIEYKAWIVEEAEKNNLKIALSPQTFLVFLEIKGIIKNEQKAEWIYNTPKSARCSYCGYLQFTNGEDETKNTLIHKAIYHYCPNCGAKMKGLEG